MIGEIDFYQEASSNYRSDFAIGNILFAPIPFALGANIPYLKFHLPGRKDSDCLYSIETENIRNFNPINQEPIYELGLKSDEFVICLAHKFRPVIIISPNIPIIPYGGSSKGKSFLVLPLYGVRHINGAYKPGFTEEFLLRAQAYQYKSIYYLPGDKKFDINESIVRFDKAIVINGEMLRPKPVCLTNDAVFCVTSWFNYLLGQDLDEIIVEYRKSAMENIN